MVAVAWPAARARLEAQEPDHSGDAKGIMGAAAAARFFSQYILYVLLVRQVKYQTSHTHQYFSPENPAT
jgi:hypothetical protein